LLGLFGAACSALRRSIRVSSRNSDKAIESTLSFPGLGIQEPTPSWGTMIAEGNEYLTFAPWTSIFPGNFLFLTMVAFNLLGDGLRDHIDTRGGGVI
jgi:ABC-type dipeptide/oligopeptide/nickel transport system permease subunit